jgi:phosphoribosyl 1,2-cyclic phosphodiesterase
MKITLWGTRGSMAAPGPETVRYGGNTSCVEVRSADGTVLILDAGTGIRRLNATAGLEVRRVNLLLTHLHMDHIQGLGFFQPMDQPGREVHIWGPPSTTLDLRARLARYLSPPLFPVRLRDLPCRLTLHHVPMESFQIGGFKIVASLVCHPGSTVGYRIAEGSTSVAYLPDHEPALGVRQFPEEADWTSGFDLAAGVDLLIHDAPRTHRVGT